VRRGHVPKQHGLDQLRQLRRRHLPLYHGGDGCSPVHELRDRDLRGGRRGKLLELPGRPVRVRHGHQRLH
jgi:hypothetical protein